MGAAVLVHDEGNVVTFEQDWACKMLIKMRSIHWDYHREPSCRRSSSRSPEASLTSTALSMTMFIYSSNPYSHPSVMCTTRVQDVSLHTLILPSILVSSCSYSHIETTVPLCSNLKM